MRQAALRVITGWQEIGLTEVCACRSHNRTGQKPAYAMNSTFQSCCNFRHDISGSCLEADFQKGQMRTHLPVMHSPWEFCKDHFEWQQVHRPNQRYRSELSGRHALAQRLTLMSCTRQRPCMRLMSPTDAKKRISVIAWRRSPSRNSSCALALIASSLNSLPSCFRSSSFTALCFPFSASCHHILFCQ